MTRLKPYNYDEETEVRIWDQRKSLKPAPYKGAMMSIAKGLNTGDPFFDDLDPKMHICHGRSTRNLPQQDDPEWVDWELVARGQELWRENSSRVFASMSLALLGGFAISRFAEVLYMNGYAQDGMTALSRYTETGFAISDWNRFSLKNPSSRARKSIYMVRSMHAFARRRSQRLFDKENGEGIALSQYDVAEVLLGFSAAGLDLMQREFGAEFSDDEIEAMTAMWRLVGYHLGVMDEYNVCSSVDLMKACYEDYMKFTPRRLECLRPCSYELRRTAIEGFALQTGLGTQFWRGAFDLIYHIKAPGFEVSHLRPKKQDFLPGMDVIARFNIKMLGNSWVLPFVNKFLLMQRDEKFYTPEKFKKRIKITTVLSNIHDRYIWRIVSMIYVYRRVLMGFFIVNLLDRLRKKARVILSKR